MPEVRDAVDTVMADYPTAIVHDAAGARASRTEALDQVLSMVTVLLLFAVLIALLGISLALSIVERTREIGLLRAVGMTRTQIRSMTRWEAQLVAMLGAVIGLSLSLGLGIGIGFGWVAVHALSEGRAEVMTVPVGRLASYLMVVAVAGVLAGLVPARRVAQLDVLESIATG